MASLRISVIMPVLNEEGTIASAIDDLRQRDLDEVIVVDGGSTDATRELCAERGIEPLIARRGRATQMNEGARRASGDILLFLHADTRLPGSAADEIRNVMNDPSIVAGRFDVKLDRSGLLFGIIGALISWRSRLTRVSTGDQAIFVRRDVFYRLGGYPEIPLMEDFALARALKRAGRIACLRSRVTTSARRWEKAGVWRTVFTMWALKALYLVGVSPLRLKRFYADAR